MLYVHVVATLTAAHDYCVSAGGADGVIMQWDVSDGTMSDGKFAGPSITLKHPYGRHLCSQSNGCHRDCQMYPTAAATATFLLPTECPRLLAIHALKTSNS